MATYWVISFSDFFWRSILTFFSDASSAKSRKHIYLFKVDCLSWFIFLVWNSPKYWKQPGGLEKRVLPLKNILIICESLSPLELWVYQVSMVSSKNWLRQLHLYVQCQIGLSRWRRRAPNLHIHHFFFNSNISGTNKVIWKR